MEIAIMITALAAAFTLGYLVGKDKGFSSGMGAALDAFRETADAEEKDIKRVQKEIDPDCGWK